MTQRNLTLDIAKGIGIILVVLGHNLFVLENPEIYRIVYSFHIPLFLFISGIFLNNTDQLKKFVAMKSDSLLKPFLILALILSIFGTLGWIRYTPNTDSAFVILFQTIYSTHGNLSLEWIALWYIPHLFLALLLSKIILQATSRFVHQSTWIWGIVILFLAIGIWFINTKFLRSPRLPFTYDVLPVTSSIILMGFLLKGKIQSMTFHLPFLLGAMLVFTLLHYFFNETVDLSSRVYSHPIISTLQAAAGVYITLSISIVLGKVEMFQRILAYVGTGSFFIMMFHGFFQVRTYYISNTEHSDWMIDTIGFALGMILPLFIWEIVKKQRFLSTIFLPNKSLRQSSSSNEYSPPNPI